MIQNSQERNWSRSGPLSRRQLLEMSGLGFGSLALAFLLNDQPLAGATAQSGSFYSDLKPRPGHFPGKAKAMIQLFQNGGPSQVDLFDPKPELTKRNGQPSSQNVETFQQGNANILLGSPFQFKRWGQCGMELAEVIPQGLTRRSFFLGKKKSAAVPEGTAATRC